MILTIILTVCRRTTYLHQAIRSVLAQTFPAFELLVTDDSNSPHVRRICASFADPRLRYRANPQTLGAPLNVAAALREARGPYTAIMNDDDLMLPAMLHTLLQPFARHPDLALAFGRHAFINSQGAPLTDATRQNARLWQRSGLAPGLLPRPLPILLCGVVFLVMGALFRTSAANPAWLLPEISHAYDHWLALRLARSGAPFFFIDQTLFHYRAHPDSQSALPGPEKAAPQVRLYSTLLQENLPPAERSLVRQNLAHQLFVLGRDRLYSRDYPAARRAFFTSARFRPSPKPLLGLLLTCAKPWR